MKYDVKELEVWQKIGIACLLIVIPGIVGWLVEFMFYYIDNGVLHWKGGNFFPWINLYAVGAYLIFLCTYKCRRNPLKVFAISVLVAGLLEYLTGFVLFKFFGIRYWDYRDEFMNINGYVCLTSLIFIGLGGIFVTNLLMPCLVKLSKTQPKKIFLMISVILCALILTDEFYNFLLIKLFNLPRAIDIYRNISFHFINFMF